ncbi:MAG TPA: hypothetical protein VE736_03780 [Gaiellaceae bacterium]|nr:hypothetical protein [Gaiellaceae bacterium]
MSSNRPDNAPERLGARPGFEEWAGDVVSALERRRRAADAAAAADERNRPHSRVGRVGRAWRFLARTVHLA